MPKRKTFWKKQNPNRHKAILRSRELEDGGQELITLRNGAQQIINPMKRFLLGKPYNNQELHKHLLRKIGTMAIGEEKMTELEKVARGESNV